MEFELIDYNIFKTKNTLKHAKLLFIFHSTRLKSKNWLLVEQALRVINLSYYKVYNKSINMAIKNSIFKNNNKLVINGTTLFSTLNRDLFEETRLPLTAKLVNAHTLVTLLFTKINNKLYSNSQTQKINLTTHKTNFLVLSYLLEKSLKKSFLVISKTSFVIL